MLAAVPPFCPPLEWEYQYPLDLGTNQFQAFDNLDFDSMFFPNLDSSSLQDDFKQQQQPPQGTSSTDQLHYYDSNNDNRNNPVVLAKKLNHNASERDRRKKINTMYSSLRSLLPATDHRKKLSIPATVGKVLQYIPELQKQVKELTHKKKVIVSKISALQQQTKPLITNEETTTTTSSFSISANKLGDKEMVIQISSYQRISIPDLLLLLQKNGFLVIHVSSFQSFGGITFYNIHFSTESKSAINFERLKEEMLMCLLQTTQKQIEVYS
nr:hypothetical protein [Suaeda aralocaspica]